MNAQTMTANEAGLHQNLGTVSDTQTTTISTSKKKLWAGWIISALPAMMLLSGGINVARKASFVLEGFRHLQYPESIALGLGLVEFACALLYVIPRTSMLGAILMTAYLGGATASHVRISEPFIGPVLFGVLVWAGLYLRDDRLRGLFPLRSR